MPAIKINNLTVGYDNVRIINNLDLSIKQGKITTIVGENGCGKSTLLKTIGRILTPINGSIEILGQNVHTAKTDYIAQVLGLLPQSPIAPQGLTVREIVEYGRFPHKKGRGALNQEDQEIINWALQNTNTHEYAETEISLLSGGQRQRVWIAMILAQNTDIILLDEPTTYLDMSHQLEILELIKNLNVTKGKTIVMVLHDINLASRFSDELIMLKKGGLVKQGIPNTTVTSEVLESVFNIDADIIQIEKDNKPACVTYELVKTKDGG